MDGAAKQQIVDKVKQANSILVTVSTNPSVDQLAACVGLTLLLGKMGKHATAVFSGKIPSTLEFLQPEKTIETNTDSLRDFIISLDKDKADKLRYKVEDQVVKIFITPYKTSLSQQDLVFSQGDYNVEVVLALGVEDKTHVDKAITAHGQILHDATVVAINNINNKNAGIGQINWLDPAASSLCEMIVSISEGFGSNLMDNQIATAFLTGIVAETKRFSNPKTSPKVMTISAQLMAAGANQQLIVSKLEPPTPVVAKETPVQVSVPHGPPPPPPAPAPEDTEAKILKDGEMNISHDNKSDQKNQAVPGDIHIDEQGNLVTAEASLPPPETSKPEQKPQEVIAPPPELAMPAQAEPPRQASAALPSKTPGPHTLLDPSQYKPSMESPFTANTEPGWSYPDGDESGDPLSSTPKNNYIGQAEHTVLPPGVTPSTASEVDSARNAVENALTASTTDLSQPPPSAKSTNSNNADKPAPPPGPPPLVLPVAGTLPSPGTQPKT